VLLDAGGVDDPIPTELLSAVDYVMPNESELARQTNVPADTDEGAFAAAEALAGAGAPRVLATLGARGALLVSKDADTGDFRRTRFPATDVPGGRVVDATAAGDAFRAAVAVFLAEDRDAETAKTRAETEDGVLVSARVARAAAAAGALAASVVGAAPSLPSRAAVAAMLPPGDQEIWGLSAPAPAQSSAADARAAADPDACPLRFGSRLNSMRSRLDLVERKLGTESSSLDLLEMVQRLGSAKGVDLVDFNYPSHLRGELGADEIARALEDAGLAAGAVAVRFPAEPFRLGGAFTNPDPAVRAAAVDVVAEACAWAAALGATRGVIVWPQFDGYDYHFGANHASAWSNARRARSKTRWTARVPRAPRVVRVQAHGPVRAVRDGE
jgi:hypothetical protein